MGKHSKAAAAAALPAPAAESETAPAADRKCPNCGGTSFAPVPRAPISEDSHRRPGVRDAKLAARAKLDGARGELLRCTGCGYQFRANDQLVPQAELTAAK